MMFGFISQATPQEILLYLSIQFVTLVGMVINDK